MVTSTLTRRSLLTQVLGRSLSRASFVLDSIMAELDIDIQVTAEKEISYKHSRHYYQFIAFPQNDVSRLGLVSSFRPNSITQL